MKYEIIGGSTPAVTCELYPGESMITQSGAMAWMSPNMDMQTSAGGFGKAFGRLFSGESLFLNTYSPMGGSGSITFAASFPGSIRAVEITPDKPLIIQKSAFIAATSQIYTADSRQGHHRGGFIVAAVLAGQKTDDIRVIDQRLLPNLAGGDRAGADKIAQGIFRQR